MRKEVKPRYAPAGSHSGHTNVAVTQPRKEVVHNRMAVLGTCYWLGAVLMLSVLVFVAHRQPVVYVEVAKGALGSKVPSLTSVQSHKAVRIATRNQDVRALLEGAEKPARVSAVIPWLNTAGNIMGAVVYEELPEPSALSGPWKDIQYDCTEGARPPYVSIPYRARRTGVRSLLILVDLSRQVVASISPSNWSPIERTSLSSPRETNACSVRQ